MQDFGAQRAAYLLNPKDGERILDACAAPGGKTRAYFGTGGLSCYRFGRDAGRENVWGTISIVWVLAKLVKLVSDGLSILRRCAGFGGMV